MRKLIFFLFILPSNTGFSQSVHAVTTDVCVYGGSSAGVIAAYTAAMLNRKVILVEPGRRLGGLSSGGLGYTDIGNKYVVSGLARDFYRRVGSHYGKFEQWIFEPRVADSIFRDYVRRGNFRVLFKSRLHRVNKAGKSIQNIELEDPNGRVALTISAKQYIDCSYEGDLMAGAGISFTTGREGNNKYGETANGVQLRSQHQFPDNIDPYKIPGQSSSGLLWGISNAMLANEGSGDDKIQSYNFRICLSSNPANSIPISRPVDYDSSKYELLLRYLAAQPARDLWGCLKMDLMPNQKTDINNNGPFSTDMIGMNYDYPNGDYAKRAAITSAHESYTKGLLYFIGHDSRMPANLRQQMLQWGYPKDEYLENDHWTPQMYIRESRRMLGAYIMTEANCTHREMVDDGVAMGAYNMDSHNCQRLVVSGMVKNEGDVQVKGINPYPVSYRSITPKQEECINLLVPVCLSASHIAYGSIRMEPVFMVLAQSAAVAASMAIDGKKAVQGIDVGQLQKRLHKDPLADKSIPEILIDNDDSAQVVLKGDWNRKTAGGYGPSLLTAAAKNTTPASATFKAEVKSSGSYKAYVYFPKLADASSTTKIQLWHGKQTQTRIVKRSEVQVSGQTSGEWVYLATLALHAGTNASIVISNDQADGLVVADAVLLVHQEVKSKK